MWYTTKRFPQVVQTKPSVKEVTQLLETDSTLSRRSHSPEHFRISSQKIAAGQEQNTELKEKENTNPNSSLGYDQSYTFNPISVLSTHQTSLFSHFVPVVMSKMLAVC